MGRCAPSSHWRASATQLTLWARLLVMPSGTGLSERCKSGPLCQRRAMQPPESALPCPDWHMRGVPGAAKKGRELQAMVSALKRKAGAAAAAGPQAAAGHGKKRRQGAARASAANV